MKRNILVPVNTLIITAIFLSPVLFSGDTAVFSQEIDECLECHMDRNLTKADDSGKVHSLYVAKDAFMRSVHVESEYTCVECHEGVKADNHPEGGIPDVKCGACHEEVLEKFKKSNHGKLLDSGEPEAPRCFDCHSKHEVLHPDNPDSAINPENQIKTCGKCHEKETRGTILALIATQFKNSGKDSMVHDFSTKRCTYCHFEVGQHGNDELIPKNCIKCHGSEKFSAIFGKVHKTSIFQSPFLDIILICFVLAGFLLVFFCRKIFMKKGK